MKEYNKQYLPIWYENNKEHVKEYNRANKEYHIKYRLEHKIESAEYFKKYYQEHKADKLEYQIKKRRNNLKYNLNHKISGAILKSLKRNKNGYRWEDLVGYSLDALMNRLLQTMPKGYTWQDYMEGKLHVDHIVPNVAFNYDSVNHPDFKRCWDLSNLRLLPARENISKGDRLIKPFQPCLKICITEVN